MEYLSDLDANWAEEFLNQRLSKEPGPLRIDPAQLKAFCAHHDVPQEQLTGLIRGTHVAMIEEQKRLSQITPSTLSSLAQLEQAAAAFADILNNLGDDCLSLLSQAAIARGVANLDHPVIVAPVDGEHPKLYLGDLKAEPISKISDQARAIAKAVPFARKAAEAGKPGPKKDDSIEIALIPAYLFWTQILRREFKLDWTRNHHPLTPAAEWCIGYLHLIDPSIPGAKIVSAARKLREKPNDPYTWEDLSASANNITSE